MFSKVVVLATTLLATLAVAYPGGGHGGGHGGAPPPSPPPAPPPAAPPAAPGTSNLCCQSSLAPSDPVVSSLAAELGVDLTGVLGNVGLGCTLLSVVGNTCSTTTVNCDSTQYGGLINIGCVPITV
ncbi:fungal hydrophobin [Mycena pura]|uniref:Hydrophobin n=1 Tax=Mycena pura TaxID=153505 RepID=A0AAD6Y847_9AGAR|nr:fungal hydrophobin [Mycena pura]